MCTLTGQWKGQIIGTNTGAVLLDFSDEAGTISGVIEVLDDNLGRSTFDVSGSREERFFGLRIIPRDTQPGTVVTPGSVRGRIDGDGSILGVWETELGSAGKVSANRITPKPPRKPSNGSMKKPDSKRPALTPLWVISLFLSLTEIVTGIAVTQATGGVQVALTVFVIVFPLFVAGAFFAVLWNRPYVFYPPTEFGGGTNVLDYVRAFGGAPSIDSGTKQQWLIGGATENAATAAESPGKAQLEPRQKTSSNSELGRVALKYFAFQQMRYTDVSNADSRAIFNLGVDYQFNLFDGLSGIVFFGFFHEVEMIKIVTRVRFLLDNLQAASVRLSKQPDSAQQQVVRQILDQLSIVVLVPEEADLDVVQSKIEEFRPTGSKVPVKAIKPSEMREFVKAEYQKMGLGESPV